MIIFIAYNSGSIIADAAVCFCRVNFNILSLFEVWWYLYFMQAITSNGTKKGELFLGDVSTQVKRNNVTADIKVDTNSNVS